jgi:plastocyanin
MNFLRYGLVFAFLAGPAPATQPAEKPPAAAVVITIENFRFSPAEITVAAGTVVRWVNKDDVPHTATAKGREPAFDTRALDTDDAFSFEFKRPGVYAYYCKIHPHMTGKVIVK